MALTFAADQYILSAWVVSAHSKQVDSQNRYMMPETYAIGFYLSPCWHSTICSQKRIKKNQKSFREKKKKKQAKDANYMLNNHAMVNSRLRSKSTTPLTITPKLRRLAYGKIKP